MDENVGKSIGPWFEFILAYKARIEPSSNGSRSDPERTLQCLRTPPSIPIESTLLFRSRRVLRSKKKTGERITSQLLRGSKDRTPSFDETYTKRRGLSSSFPTRFKEDRASHHSSSCGQGIFPSPLCSRRSVHTHRHRYTQPHGDTDSQTHGRRRRETERNRYTSIERDRERDAPRHTFGFRGGGRLFPLPDRLSKQKKRTETDSSDGPKHAVRKKGVGARRRARDVRGSTSASKRGSSEAFLSERCGSGSSKIRAGKRFEPCLSIRW